MTTPVTAVPFGSLVAPDEINARSATKDGLDELAASIAVKGLIAPLVVRLRASDSPAGSRPDARSRSAAGGRRAEGVSPAANQYEVIDGRRRYQAIAKLIKAGTLAKKGYEVPVIVRDEDDADALETSLMANTVRLPMHPVDQHEVFARLAAQGRTTAEIAARFGVAERTVRQHLALGRLAPVIREAWRKGKIDAETAQAFTLADDQDVQAATFARLSREKHYGAWDWRVRQELSQKRERVARSAELRLVGEEAYLAAGGTISESLFEDDRYIDDVPLLAKLARDVIEARLAELRADGWAWAAVHLDDYPDGVQTYDCDHVRGDPDDDGYDSDLDELPPGDYSPEEKARSGVVVGIEHDGSLRLYTGLILDAAASSGAGDSPSGSRPPAQSAASGQLPSGESEAANEEDDAAGGRLAERESPAATEEDSYPFKITQALREAVTTTRTLAAAEALAADPDLALKAAFAALTSDLNCPIKLHVGSDALGRAKVPHGSFVQRLDAIEDWPTERVAAELAQVVAWSLSLVALPGYVQDKRSVAACDALAWTLDGATYLAAARRLFVAADYFKRAGKDTALAAIDEMREAGCAANLAPEDELAGMKKADLATAAAEAAAACGWLPPELRHPSYAIGAA